MRTMLTILALSVALPLTACNQSRSQDIAHSAPADFTVVLDPSVSHALQTDKEYASRAAARIRDGLLDSDIDLGEKIVIYYLGNRGPREVLSESIPIERQRSKRAVADELYRRIATIPDREKGKDYTNLLFVLQNTAFRCGNGRGQVWIASDGIPADARDFADGRGLIAGTSQLPRPVRRPFAGCERVTWLGLGILAEGVEPISTQGIVNLERQWRGWSVAAGLADGANFHSITGF